MLFRHLLVFVLPLYGCVLSICFIKERMMMIHILRHWFSSVTATNSSTAGRNDDRIYQGETEISSILQNRCECIIDQELADAAAYILSLIHI